MNARFKNTPEVIASVSTVDSNGNDTDVGDKVTGVMVRNSNGTPVVQLDIRNYKKDSNLTVEIEAAELMAALTQALVHAERE
jgi:hypothetical protein